MDIHEKNRSKSLHDSPLGKFILNHNVLELEQTLEYLVWK